MTFAQGMKRLGLPLAAILGVLMAALAGLSLLLGLVPRPFVTAATAAHEAIVLHPVVHH